MYKRTKFKIPFYPAYNDAYKYFLENVANYDENPYRIDHELFLLHFEDWLEEQGTYFHRRSPYAKQNHNIFFETDEQRVMFLLKVSQ